MRFGRADYSSSLITTRLTLNDKAHYLQFLAHIIEAFPETGWSPKGIDYMALDGMPVVLVVMYIGPNNQRNHHLREVPILAKALETQPDLKNYIKQQTWTMSATTSST